MALSCADSKGVFNGSLTRLLSGMDRSVCALHDERRLDPADPEHRALDTIALHWEGVVFRKLREVGHDGIPHRDKTVYVTPYDLELCCDRDFTDGLVASLVSQPDVMTRQSFLLRCLGWANNDYALVISQLLLFLVAHKPRFNGRTFSFKDEQGHGEQLKAVLEACGPGSDGEAPARKIIVEVIDDILVEVRAALLSYADILAEFRYQFVGRNEFYSPPGKDKWPSEEHFLAHVDALEKNQARWLSSRNAFFLATYATMLPMLYAGLSALIGKSALSFVETVAPVEGVGQERMYQICRLRCLSVVLLNRMSWLMWRGSLLAY